MMYTAPLKAFLTKTGELKDKVGSNIIINVSLGAAEGLIPYKKYHECLWKYDTCCDLKYFLFINILK